MSINRGIVCLVLFCSEGTNRDEEGKEEANVIFTHEASLGKGSSSKCTSSTDCDSHELVFFPESFKSRAHEKLNEHLPILRLLGNTTSTTNAVDLEAQDVNFEKLLSTCLSLESLLSFVKEGDYEELSYSSSILPQLSDHTKATLRLQGLLDSYCSRRDTMMVQHTFDGEDYPGHSLMILDNFYHRAIMIISVNVFLLLVFFLFAFVYLILRAKALYHSPGDDMTPIHSHPINRSGSMTDTSSMYFTADLKNDVYRNIKSLSGSQPLRVDSYIDEGEQLHNPHRELTSHSFYFTHFIHKKIIGKGGCGAVFLAEHRTTGINYAVKIVAISSSMSSRIISEASMHASFDHVNVVRYFSSWEEELTDAELRTLRLVRVSPASLTSSEKAFDRTSESSHEETSRSTNRSVYVNRFLFIQMSYYEHGTLRDWLARVGRSVDVMENLSIFHQLTNGLMYLHSLGILHRDLKPGNIFMSYSSTSVRTDISASFSKTEKPPLCVKIGDFGLSISQNIKTLGGNGKEGGNVDYSDRTAGVGTPAYCSPEQLTNGRVSEASDVFALGIIMLECFIDVHTESEKHAIFAAARQGCLSKCQHDVTSRYPEVVQLITEMISSDPTTRILLRCVKVRLNEFCSKKRESDSSQPLN